MILVTVGLALGSAGGWTSTRLLSAQLFGVAPTDPVAFLVGILLLATVTLAAAWIPARKAARVEPMNVLRTE